MLTVWSQAASGTALLPLLISCLHSSDAHSETFIFRQATDPGTYVHTKVVPWHTSEMWLSHTFADHLEKLFNSIWKKDVWFLCNNCNYSKNLNRLLLFYIDWNQWAYKGVTA